MKLVWHVARIHTNTWLMESSKGNPFDVYLSRAFWTLICFQFFQISRRRIVGPILTAANSMERILISKHLTIWTTSVYRNASEGFSALMETPMNFVYTSQ